MAYSEWRAAGKRHFRGLGAGVAFLLSLASCTEPNEGQPPGHAGGTSGGAGGSTTVVVSPDAMPDGNREAGGDVPPGAAHLFLDATAHDFGTVLINSLGTAADFVITNDGGATSGTLLVTLTAPGSFQIMSDGCSGKTLAPGASCRVTVIFSPVDAGKVDGTIRFTAPGFDAMSALTAEGITPGVLKMVPDAQNFGPVVPPTPTMSQTFTVTNTGQQKTGALTATLGGSDMAAFAITADSCTGHMLASGTACTVLARFAPPAGIATGPKASSLTVTGMPGGAVVAQLSGNAQAPSKVVILPGMADFGQVLQGKSSTTKQFVAQNSGQATTAPLTASVSGSDFVIVDDGCKNQTLAASAMCTVSVQFMPGTGTSSSRLGTLTVSELGGGSANAGLSGTALANAVLRVSPTSKDFNNVTVGQPATATFQVNNDGDVASTVPAATISGTDAADFTIPPATNACTAAIPAKGSCMLVVRFVPSTSATLPRGEGAMLTVVAATGGMATATLQGTAIGPSLLQLNLTSFDFKGVEQGTVSPVATFTVTNKGQSATGAVSGRIVGSAVFTVVSNLCANMMLAPGNSCSLTVRFEPVASGPASSTLEVSSTPGGTSTASLSGNGLQPALLTINPTAFTFPATVVNALSANQTFSVTNTGGVAAGTSTGLMVALGGNNQLEFKLVTSNCTGALAAGNSCMVVVAFAPKSAGDKTANITVTGTPGGSPSAAIAGTAQKPAQLSLSLASGSSASFGNVAVGAALDRVYVVRNDGDQSSSAVGLTVSGAGFALLAPTTGECVPGTTTLAGGASCTVRVRFAPTVAGTQNATLGAAATTGGTASLALTGTGQRAAALTGTNSNNFGTVVVTTQTGTVNWTIVNAGDVPTSVPTLTNSNSAEVFVNNGCTGAIPGGGSCTIGVSMKPSAAGLRMGILTLTAATGGSVTFTATATGQTVAGLQLAPFTGSSTNFGDVLVGGTVTETFAVTNAGGQSTTAITITLTNAMTTSGFALVAPTTGECVPGVTILAGLASCNVRVRFTAPAGMQSASLAVSATAGGSPNPLPLIGNGQRPAALSGTATNAYGNVVVGATSTAFTWTITNNGDVASGVPVLTNGNQSELVIGSNSCNVAIPAGVAGKCTISVSFRPSAAGARTGTLTLAATPGGSVTLTTTATGLSPASLGYSTTPSPAFGNVLVGSTVDRTFVLTNNGQQATTAVTVSLTPAGSAFSVLPATTGDCTTGTILAAGATCNVRIRFTAPATAGLQTALLGATAATGGSAPALSLSGNAQRAALLTGSTTNDFGAFVVGATSGSVTWTVTNGGDMATGIPALVNGDPTEVMVGPNTCTTALAGGGTCTISVSFRPGAVDVRSGTLTLTATPGGSVTFKASATGLTAAALTVTPQTGSQVDFGNVLVGSFQDEVFVVTNGGGQATSPITVTLAPTTADFALLGSAGDCVSGTTTLAANGICLLHVRFQPSSDVASTVSLGISAATGGSGSLTLTGRGQTAALLQLEGASTNLGYVLMPRAPTAGDSATATFVLRNTGDQTATGISIALSPPATGFSRGTDATDDCGTSLDGGKTCQIRVVFAPTVAGASSTTLSVTATVGGTTSSFMISGVGQPRPVFLEYPIPTPSSGVGGIAVAKDGSIWFTETAVNNIARLDPTSGHISEFPILTMASGPMGIAAAADGSLWFTESNVARIGRVTWDAPSAIATITEFPSPVGMSPTGIAAAADGGFWFAESIGNGIGHMTADGTYNEAPALMPAATPQGVAVVADGSVWFTESTLNSVGTLAAGAASVMEFPLGPPDAGPLGIALGGDSRVWFTEQKKNSIAAVTAGGSFSEYPIKTSGSQPTGITQGADHNMWFVEQVGNKVARILPTGVITEFAVPNAAAAPQAIVSTSDPAVVRLYYTEPGANAIGCVYFP